MTQRKKSSESPKPKTTKKAARKTKKVGAFAPPRVLAAEIAAGSPNRLPAPAIMTAELAVAPEEGDRPVGGLTDAQLGSLVRVTLADGRTVTIYRRQGQIYFRVS